MKTKIITHFFSALIIGFIILNGCTKKEENTSNVTAQDTASEIFQIPLYKPNIDSIFSSVQTPEDKERLGLEITKEAEKNWKDILKRSDDIYRIILDSSAKTLKNIEASALSQLKEKDPLAYREYMTFKDLEFFKKKPLEKELRKNSAEFERYRTVSHAAWVRFLEINSTAENEAETAKDEARINYREIDHKISKLLQINKSN